MALYDEVKAARAAGVSDAALAPALKLQRKAQFRADFVNAENSMGFHAPQEAARILGEAIDYARQGQLAALQERTSTQRREAEKAALHYLAQASTVPRR